MQKAVEKEIQLEKQRQAQLKLQQQHKQMQLEQNQQKQEKKNKKKPTRDHRGGNGEPTADGAESEDEQERTDSVNKNAAGTDMSKQSNKEQSILNNSVLHFSSICGLFKLNINYHIICELKIIVKLEKARKRREYLLSLSCINLIIL